MEKDEWNKILKRLKKNGRNFGMIKNYLKHAKTQNKKVKNIDNTYG